MVSNTVEPIVWRRARDADTCSSVFLRFKVDQPRPGAATAASCIALPSVSIISTRIMGLTNGTKVEEILLRLVSL
jgi:hypothetical protein